jgi:hypothetical protein
LADFLSDHTDLQGLKKVLGTRLAVFRQIENRVNLNVISITQGISEVLSEWNSRTGLHKSTVSLLCNGSAVSSADTKLTEGLRNNGFNEAAGTLGKCLNDKSRCETKCVFLLLEHLLNAAGVTDQTLISSKFTPPRDCKRIHLQQN